MVYELCLNKAAVVKKIVRSYHCSYGRPDLPELNKRLCKIYRKKPGSIQSLESESVSALENTDIVILYVRNIGSIHRISLMIIFKIISKQFLQCIV